MSIKSYQDLLAWQKAMDFVVMVYRVSAAFPREEIYGLTSQVRKAAVSVPSNIAEGQGRRADRQFNNFLMIAHGSLREAETQIIIGRRLDYMNEESKVELLDLAAEVGRLINGLDRSLTDT